MVVKVPFRLVNFLQPPCYRCYDANCGMKRKKVRERSSLSLMTEGGGVVPEVINPIRNSVTPFLSPAQHGSSEEQDLSHVVVPPT